MATKRFDNLHRDTSIATRSAAPPIDKARPSDNRGVDDPVGSEISRLTDRMQAVRKIGEGKRFGGFTAFKELWDARIKDNVFGAPFYGLIASIARFLGDTRTSHPDPAVDAELLAEMKAVLQAGDVILVRQDRYADKLDAYLDGHYIVTSREPLLDGARELLRKIFSPIGC